MAYKSTSVVDLQEYLAIHSDRTCLSSRPYSSDYSLHTNPFSNRILCNEHNLELSLNCLVKDLDNMGYYSDNLDQVGLVNACNYLIELNLKWNQQREELNERHSRIMDQNRSEIQRLKANLERSERSVKDFTEKNRQLGLKNNTLQVNARSEKENAKKLQSVIQQRDSQYQHEIRRKETEIKSLKDHLYQILKNQTGEKRSSMTLLNVLPRADGSRGKWNTDETAAQQVEEVNKQVIDTYKKRSQVLLEENLHFRETLYQICTLGSESSALLETTFQLPFDRLSSHLKTFIDQHLHQHRKSQESSN